MKRILRTNLALAPAFFLSFFLLQGQLSAQLINPAGDGGFENGSTFAANGWSSDNGAALNTFVLGTVPPGFTNRCAFITNDAGTSWAYTNTNTSVVHFWRDVTFPAGQSNINLSFNWQALGETSSFDALMVSLAPTSYTPVASTVSLGTGALAAPATTIAQLWNVNAVQTANIQLPISLIGNCAGASTVRLIFSWKNDGSLGTSPPVAIDNISLTASAPVAPLAGTFSVGPGGDYANLTAAAADVNARGVSTPVFLELNALYTSAGETFPITLGPNLSCAAPSSVNPVTVRPAAGAPLLTIAGTNAGPTISFNNGAWWRIDGRPGGMGTTKGLVISNNQTTGQAIQFINDATNNIVRYCDVQGMNTSTTSGVIVFSTTVGVTGNDNNLIDNCDVHDLAGSTPANCIYSSGTSTSQNHFNSFNTVSNCNIYNFFLSTSTSLGIQLTTASTEWTVTGNSFYQTSARVLASAVFAGINCASTTTNGFVITNNFIGGSAPSCGGGAMTLTGAGNFRAVNMTVGPGTSLVQGNTIQNINITSSNISGFSGALLLGQGNFNCNSNVIGSMTATGNIVFTSSGSASGFNGIALGGTSPTNTSLVTNNQIGGINVVTSGAPATPPFNRGILVSGTTAAANYIVNNNIVGSASVPSSMSGDGNLSGSVIGIMSACNALGQQITNNTVSNLTGSNTGTTNILWGILCQGSATIGTYTVTGNTVQGLTSGSGGTGSGGTASILGVQVSTNLSTIGTNIIRQNIVRSLLNNNATATASVTGMVISLPTVTSNTVDRNFVHSLNLSSSALTGIGTGIQINAGINNVHNNMVRLGVDATGADITTGYGFIGIREAGGTSNINFNSVYIGGNGVTAGTTNTFAFSAATTTGTRNYLNNIFYNARSNGAGAGKHYAITVGGTVVNPAGIFSNYNDLRASGTGGFVGLYNALDQTTLANWRTATGLDFQSINADPMYLTPNGSTATVDLHINAAVPTSIEAAGQPLASVTTDFDGQTRATLTPTDIGADAGNFLLLDVSAPGIGFSPLVNACGTGDITLSNVNITDGTGIPLAGALVPRIYFRKNTGAWFSRPGTLSAGAATNSTWNFTIVVADMGGIVAGDIVDYYVIAQDNLGNVGSNFGGVVATNVNTVTTHPVTPNNVTVVNALSLTYTVGIGQAYTTLTAAVADYNTKCINGPIVFSLTDATYPTETFPITINANAVASSVNTLTIKPAVGVNATISGSSATGLIVLNGADWVTIDGSNGNVANSICPPSSATRNLTFTNTSTSTTSAVIWLQNVVSTPNGATNNRIINCNISGNGPLQTLCGIGSGNPTLGTASLGNNNNNNTFVNNNISNAQYGIISQGNSAFNKNTGNVINQNLMNTAAPANLATGGVFVAFEDNVTISGNNISGMSQASSPDVCGILVGFTHSGLSSTTFAGNECTNVTITNNIIGSVVNSGSFSAAGIALASTNLGTSLIANNMISGVSSNGTAGDFGAGIILGGGNANINVLYNTVAMQGTITGASGASQTSACLAVTNIGVPSALSLRNNIFSNTQMGNTGATLRFTSIALGYASLTGNYAGLTSENNDLFAAGAGPGTYQIGITGGVTTGVSRISMANWRTETGRDLNSFNVQPNFVSATDLHMVTTSNQCLDGDAIPIAGLTTDIDCSSRDASTPDIGADEFTNPNLSIKITETSGIANNDGITCSGAAVQLTANGGGTYLWSVGGFTTTSIVVVPMATTTFTVTVTNGTCTDVISATITVNPLPQAFLLTGGGAYCAGGPGVNISLTGSQLGFSYQLFLAGNPVGAPVIGTGNAISFGNQTVAGTYTCVATNPATGCINTMSNSAVVSINPLPSIASALTQPTTCVSSDGAINLTISGPAGPYTYNWSTPNGSGLVNGQEDQTGLTVGTYFVTVTETTTGCTNTASITLIGPGGCSVCPTIGALADAPTGAVCEGSSFTLTASGLVDMGTTYGIIFKYSAVALADPYSGGTVLATVANGALTGGGTIATANVSIPLAGTYFIYAILSPSPLDAGCRPSQSLSKTINPIPSATATPVTQTICSANAITTIVWSGPVPNTTYNWTRNNTVNLTGIPANGSGNVAGTLTNITNVAQTTVFTVTPTANGCTGNSSTTATVIVNPTPNAVATPAAQTICSGNLSTAIVLSGNVGGSAFNWTRNNVATVTGIAASGAGNIPASTLINTTNAPITVTFTITPTANNCPGAAITATILVNPTPALFTLTGGGTVCNTDNIGVPVGLNGSQTNVNYQLFRNGVPIGATVAGTGAAISFGLQLAGNYTVVATHTQGACTSTMTGTITIGTFNCNVAISDPCVCLNNATTLFNGQFGEVIKVNAPGTQVWTVTAINGLFRDPNVAPPSAPLPIAIGTVLTNLGAAMNMFELKGRHVDAIGYTVTVSNGAGTSLSIGNKCEYPNPAITSDLSGAFCLFSNPVNLTGNPGDANIVSQGFTVNGVPSTQFNPALGPGQYQIVYTVNGGTPKAFGPNDPGCTQSVSTFVNVIATPTNLVCNDLVYISLDADCTEQILPDDILEGTYGCYDDYIVEIDKSIPFGNGPWLPGVVNMSDFGKTYQVRVTHLVSGNKCWGNIKVEDKLPPVLSCENFTIPCNTPNLTPDYLKNVLGISVARPIATDCQTVTFEWVDTETDMNCASGLSKTISRKWTATDASGNSTTCIQTISLRRPGVDDLKLPPSYDGFDAPGFNCTAAYPTPDWIEGQGLQGYPWVFGRPDGCNINWAYKDILIGVCDGTYKIVREWTLLNWCVGQVIHYDQVIKVSDNEAPNMTCPGNMTVSVDPFGCCATVDLPDLVISDNCSRVNNIGGMVTTFDPYTGAQTGMYTFGGNLLDFPGNNWWDRDTLAAFGNTTCLPVGPQTVTYRAEDDCGNARTCTFRLTVRDYVPPVASCDQTTTVAIGGDDLNDCYTSADGCDFAGVTWVKATTFNDGSYDNCNNVKLTVQRMEPYSDCIKNLDAAPCYPNGWSEYQTATNEQDSIKFYCCEVGTTQTVILNVYQVDVNGNLSIGPDGEAIKNQCMVQVEVQDKLKPQCISPANVTVNCENFDPSLWAYGKAQVADNCCLDTSKVYQGQCGLTHTVAYNNFDTVCNKGTITRTFRAWDCHGLSSQCTQRVVVTYEQDYFIKFPNDAIVTVCDGTGNYGEPSFFGEDCELLGVSFEDEVFTVVPDACFKIERTWSIINWCTYNPNLPCINVPNPNPNPQVNNPANLVGPTVSECGTPQAPAPNNWAPTVVKINPTDAQATNFCTFWDKNANCYKYKQIIKIIDGKAPEGTYVVPDCSNAQWFSPNNGQLWNEMYWWNNGLQLHDLCEEPTDLCITGTDACSGANINIEYLLFLDLDGDGTMETVVNSVSTGINGLGWNNVLYNNLNTPNFAGGTPRQFDERAVPSNQKWGFAIQETVSGNNKTACVRWNTQQSQNSFVAPELPHGTHKIKWFITDGCGNNKEYEYTFTVKDCKAPTVVCLNGLSVNIMPTGMITLWASDFLQYTEDNCTPTNQLRIGIRKCGTGTGFPFDANGNPITNVTFTCAETGTQCVELWSIDAAGNADYCETYVIVQDNLGNCAPGGQVIVSGTLKTETEDGIEEAVVNLVGVNLTDAQGVYSFNNVPLASSFTIAPEKDDNPLNGVTTYDLVLISKHILGIAPLTTPYKMIAADANKSGSITTFDIVEIRKLILGIYTELPSNTSWRFVDKAFTFPSPVNPFQTVFPEVININNALVNQLNQDFVGVKIGDVNNTAVSNALMQSEERTSGTAIFDIEDRNVKAGEEFEVTFKSAQALKGFQFTASLNGLKAISTVDADNVTPSNFNLTPENAMAVSIDGAQGFTVRFRAEKAGKLSEMLGVSGSITRAEAYGDAGRLNVAFRFRSPAGMTISSVGFELYQNQPNPFVNRTFVGFFLPEAAEATLSVFDETGRVVYQQKGQFAKGENTIALDRALINTTGVLFYKLETATDSATKKMIQAK